MNTFQEIATCSSSPPSSSSITSNKENLDSAASRHYVPSSSSSPLVPKSNKRRCVEFGEPVLLSSPPQPCKQASLVGRVLDEACILSSDPLCPTPAPAKKARKSILKSSPHPIQLARTLGEGTRANSGPRRHTLALPDLCDTMNANAVKTCIGEHTTLQDLLRSPLSALAASLKQDQSPFDPSSSSSLSSSSSTEQVHVEPREVELAYTQLMDRMRAWVTSIRKPDQLMSSAALSPADIPAAKEAVSTAFQCLERDLKPSLWESDLASGRAFSSSPMAHADTMNKRLHLMSPNCPPSSSSPIEKKDSHYPVSSTPRPGAFQASSPFSLSKPTDEGVQTKRQGKTELEIQRKRVQIDVAQAAIKCLAVLLHHSCFYRLASEKRISTAISNVLQIPHAASLRLPKDRDIVAFSIWLVRAQALPSALLEQHAAPIQAAIKACFTNFKPNSDKPRRAVLEALSAVHFLSMNYPHLFVCRLVRDQEFRDALFAYALKDNLAIRQRGWMALGGLYASILQHWRLASPQVNRESRPAVAEMLGRYLCDYLQSDEHANLANLERLMENAKAKPEELMWLLHVLGLLPVITGHRFRKLEVQGPQMWMRFMTICLTHQNLEVVGLAFLIWDHLIYSWMAATQSYKTKDVVWGLTEKPLQLLTQIINRPPHLADAENPLRANAIQGRQVLHVVNSLLYGFSGYIASYIADTGSNTSLAQYDTLWSAVRPHLSGILTREPTPADVTFDAQKCFSAVVDFRKQTKIQARWQPERVLSEDLIACWTVTSTSVENTASQLAEAEWNNSVKSDEISSFSQHWIVENMSQLLDMFSECLDASLLQAQSQPTGAPVVPPCPDVLIEIFSSLVAAQCLCSDDARSAQQSVCQWIESQSRLSDSIRRSWISQLLRSAMKQVESQKAALPTLWPVMENAAAHTAVDEKLATLEAAIPLRASGVYELSNALRALPSPASRASVEQTCRLWIRLLEQDFIFSSQQSSEEVDHCNDQLSNFMTLATKRWPTLDETRPLLETISRCPDEVSSSALRAVAAAHEELDEGSSQVAIKLLALSSPRILLSSSLLSLLQRSMAEALTSPVAELLSSTTAYLSRCPSGRFEQAFGQLRSLFLTAFKSEACSQDAQATVDELYMRILSLASAHLQEKALGQDDLDVWHDLLVSKWAHEPSSMCSVALEEFWGETFGCVEQPLHLSDALRAALHCSKAIDHVFEPAAGSLEQAFDASIPSSTQQDADFKASSKASSPPPRQHHVAIDLSDDEDGGETEDDQVAQLLGASSQSMSSPPKRKRTRDRQEALEANDPPTKKSRSDQENQPSSSVQSSPAKSSGSQSQQSTPRKRKRASSKRSPKSSFRASSFVCVEVPRRDDVPPPLTKTKETLGRTKSATVVRSSSGPKRSPPRKTQSEPSLDMGASVDVSSLKWSPPRTLHVRPHQPLRL